MSTRTAIYAGSFDPPTIGHIDVILRGAALFDELVVAVGNNPAKRYFFDLEQRASLVREAVGAANVRVVSFSGLLVAGVRWDIRGFMLPWMVAMFLIIMFQVGILPSM